MKIERIQTTSPAEMSVSANFSPGERSHLEKLVRELFAITGGKRAAVFGSAQARRELEGSYDLNLIRRVARKIKEIKAFTDANAKKRRELMGVPEGFMGYDEIQAWLKNEKLSNGRPLESRLAGGSFEKSVDAQEEFYKTKYGKSFGLDRSKIMIEASRKERIKRGLEVGCVDFPLIVATPDTLVSEEEPAYAKASAGEEWTAAQYAYHKFMEPLKNAGEGVKIWGEMDSLLRWSLLSLEECLERYIPVEVGDFDDMILTDKNWQGAVHNVINNKVCAPTQTAGKVELIFTDSRQNVPFEQRLINQDGTEVGIPSSFMTMIKDGITVLTPEQWITLASQIFEKSGFFLAVSGYDYLMAVAKTNTLPQVSIAIAGTEYIEGEAGNEDEVLFRLDVIEANVENEDFRCRVAL